MVPKDDWRRNDQESYLSNAVLIKAVFPKFWQEAYAQRNDFYEMVFEYAQQYVKDHQDSKEYLDGENIQHFWHEHCSFCWEKFATDKACVCYCDEDMRYWICAECFNDFREEFGWTVK